MSVITKLAVLGSTAITLVACQTAISVDVATQLQAIDGFGFSQAFGRAVELQNASAETQTQALDLLFNTSTGAGFSIIRNRIGSGEDDSILPTSPGSPTATPDYVWDDDDSGQLWFSQKAVEYGVSTIYADAWSAPGFMKTNGDEAAPGYLCGTWGHTCDSGDWKQAYADYLVKYVKFYASAGITITHLGFLNEPDWEVEYSQMQISTDAKEAIQFIPILFNATRGAGLTTELACCDAVGWDSQDNYTTSLVAGGSTKYLSVITGHSYTSDAVTPLNQTSLRKWNTEAGPTDTPFGTVWHASGESNEGMTWANKLSVAMVQADLSAYLFWEGFEDQQPDSALHLVNALDGETVTPSSIFWAFAMWSRYIRPGAVRVATSGTISDVITGAFKNGDGSVVTVFTNSGTTASTVEVNFNGFTPTTAEAWRTSQGYTFQTHNTTLSGGAVTVNLPGHSVVTLKLQA